MRRGRRKYKGTEGGQIKDPKVRRKGSMKEKGNERGKYRVKGQFATVHTISPDKNTSRMQLKKSIGAQLIIFL